MRLGIRRTEFVLIPRRRRVIWQRCRAAPCSDMASRAATERAETARVRNLVAPLRPGDTIDIATPLKARKARTCLRPLLKDEYGGLMLHAFETITGGVRVKCRSAGWRMPSMGTPDALYHVATPEVAAIILREGFK